jgi:hypothetical protein
MAAYFISRFYSKNPPQLMNNWELGFSCFGLIWPRSLVRFLSSELIYPPIVSEILFHKPQAKKKTGIEKIRSFFNRERFLFVFKLIIEVYCDKLFLQYNYNITQSNKQDTYPQRENMNENLTIFHKNVKENPLFAAEGLDLENIKYALGELRNSLEEVRKSWKSVTAKLFFLKYSPEETAHPVSFLESFLNSERLRRDFLLQPNIEKAKNLLESWQNTLQEYKSGIHSYKSALLAVQRLEGLKENQKLAYFDSSPKFIDYIDWTSLLLENSNEIESEMKDYQSLLVSGGKEITIKKRNEDNFLSNVISSLENIDLPDIPNGIKELVNIIETKYTAEEKFESVVYPLDHFNKGKIVPRRFNVIIGEGVYSKPKQLIVLLSDDVYFLNLAKGHFVDLIIYRPLIEAKLDYWYQPATTFYSNLDVSYQAGIGTLVDLKRRKFENKTAVLEQQSSLLDLLIGTGVRNNIYFSNLLKILAYHNKLPKLSFFYLARAYPTLYFLSFNKSVWRIKKSPKINASRFGPHSHYETYYDLHDKIPLETLKKVVDISVNRMNYYQKELA